MFSSRTPHCNVIIIRFTEKNAPFCRSPIHGRGLFCKKTIEAGEMVIEYSGNVIRSVLTDKREKYYDGKVRINSLPL